MNALIDVAIGNTIYTGIVPKNQPIDNENETPLYAEELENGMMAVLEPNRRGDETTSTYPQLQGVTTKNRWCEVTKVRRDGQNTWFVGVYADGETVFRTHQNEAGFYVKKVSIPAKTPVEKTSYKPSGTLLFCVFMTTLVVALALAGIAMEW